LEIANSQEVQAPSQKVYFYDTSGRHFGKFGFQQWQGFQSSRQPLGASILRSLSGSIRK